MRRLRQPEVHQHGTAFGQHDVPGLQIAMHDSLPVRHRQRFGHRDPDLKNLAQPQCTSTQALGQSFPFEKLHHQIICAILRADVVEMADMGMIQRGDSQSFALHPLIQFGRRRKMGSKNLDGDRAVEPGVAGKIHFTHTAGSERRLNFIKAKLCARGQRHWWDIITSGEQEGRIETAILGDWSATRKPPSDGEKSRL